MSDLSTLRIQGKLLVTVSAPIPTPLYPCAAMQQRLDRYIASDGFGLFDGVPCDADDSLSGGYHDAAWLRLIDGNWVCMGCAREYHGIEGANWERLPTLADAIEGTST